MSLRKVNAQSHIIFLNQLSFSNSPPPTTTKMHNDKRRKRKIVDNDCWLSTLHVRTSCNCIWGMRQNSRNFLTIHDPRNSLDNVPRIFQFIPISLKTACYYQKFKNCQLVLKPNVHATTQAYFSIDWRRQEI